MNHTFLEFELFKLKCLEGIRATCFLNAYTDRCVIQNRHWGNWPSVVHYHKSGKSPDFMMKQSHSSYSLKPVLSYTRSTREINLLMVCWTRQLFVTLWKKIRAYTTAGWFGIKKCQMQSTFLQMSEHCLSPHFPNLQQIALCIYSTGLLVWTNSGLVISSVSRCVSAENVYFLGLVPSWLGA